MTTTTNTEAEYHRRTIREAQAKLDALNIEAQVERNKINQQREFEASKRAVEDTRQRHASLEALAEQHLSDLKAAIADAHFYSHVTDPDGKFVYKGYKCSRQHVVPGNPQPDPAKRVVVDAAAQRLTQTLTSLFQNGVRLEHNEARFADLKATVYAGVAFVEQPAPVEPTPTAEIEQPAPVSMKAIVHEALTTV